MDTNQVARSRTAVEQPQDVTGGAGWARRTAALLQQAGFVPAALSTVLCVVILATRLEWSGSLRYVFLLWNLFLAWLPWLFALPFAEIRSVPGRGWRLLPLFAAWLVFLPNAPYIVTDLLHLKPARGIPLWFDAMLLFTFAWTGCVLGFFSLRVVHARIAAWLGRGPGWLFVFAASLLTGFGIYLGRFLRWNSWNVVTRPEALARDIVDRIVHPHHHLQTWGVTVLLAAFFVVGYIAFVLPAQSESRRAPVPHRAHRG